MLERQGTFQKKQYGDISKNKRNAISPLAKARGLLARDIMKLLLLDLPGLIATAIIGGAIFYFGGAFALQYIALMLVFLAAGVFVTKHDYERKRELAVFEHERSWENVFANGIIPAFCVAAASVDPRFFGAFICSVAAITADKFGSELGVLGGEPFSLLTLKKVRPGISGAVSLLGLFVSFDGAALIGLASYFLFPGHFTLVQVLLIAVIGFAGSLADSAAGIPENAGIGNKSTTNIICAIAGAALGYYLIA